MIRAETCCVAVCDACDELLRDCESEATIHFESEAHARTTARALGWLVTDRSLICPERDDQHQAAFDRLMPAEPAPLNQPTLDGGAA